MAVICPTVTEYDLHSYRQRMERLETFAKRVHIDLMDGQLAPTKSPDLDQIWWPQRLAADIHLMYRRPMDYIDQLIKLKPRLVVIHAEAELDHLAFAARLHDHDIKAGLAILQATTVEATHRIMDDFDHVLVFSGNLGHHKGQAELGLLDKVRAVRQYYPDIEIGWDGGVNNLNAKQLVEGGVDVLNVGGFIANADDPQEAYAKLGAIVKGL